jgi:hypothetical protein
MRHSPNLEKFPNLEQREGRDLQAECMDGHWFSVARETISHWLT